MCPFWVCVHRRALNVGPGRASDLFVMSQTDVNNVKWFLAPERLHSSAHRRQAEPDGGGQLSAAERGDTQRRVPAGHHAAAPRLTGGAARHRGPAHFQTGQRQSGEQGVTEGGPVFHFLGVRNQLSRWNDGVSCVSEWADPAASRGAGRSRGDCRHVGQTGSLHLRRLAGELHRNTEITDYTQSMGLQNFI